MSLSLWGSRPPLVLIVDDQEANIRLLGTVLSDAGFDVMPAESGKRALARMEAADPDVVLLDMRMPNMDGFEVLERLKSNPDWEDIPVVFLTAASEREHLLRAFEGGAVDYIVKPFVAEELVARVRTHAELKRSRDQLHLAIREREDLATIVAHDLKNPLFNISLNANLLAGDLNDDGQRKRAASIESSAKKALGFVERYLEQRASLELRRGYQPQDVAVSQLFELVLEAFADEADRRGMSLSLGEVDDLAVACDLDSTQLVLRNLMSNALKYAPAGSEVELGATAAPGAVRIWVADRGPGISADDKARLFRRYVRLSAEANPGAASSGVGLAVARQEAEWMGGDLRHEDRPGGGSIFILELNRAKPASG
ncbi:MAG: hybrid sensor histidine kinase/response regulator [Lysobacteraceae bacterium]